MKSRVEQFEAHVPVPKQDMHDVPRCRESFAKWLVATSAAFASRAVLSGPELPVNDGHAPQPHDEPVEGLAALMSGARMPEPPYATFRDELLALGAVHVKELGPEEWPRLQAWSSLRPLEQRRLAHALGVPC